MWVWDVDGRKFLDFSAGIAVNALGHADEGVLKASLIYFHGWFYVSIGFNFKCHGYQLLVLKLLLSSGLMACPPYFDFYRVVQHFLPLDRNRI